MLRVASALRRVLGATGIESALLESMTGNARKQYESQASPELVAGLPNLHKFLEHTDQLPAGPSSHPTK
jgi:hypothetical protein